MSAMLCDTATRKHRMRAPGVRANKRVSRSDNTNRSTTSGHSPRLVATLGAVGLDELLEVIAGTRWHDDIIAAAQNFESGLNNQQGGILWLQWSSTTLEWQDL